MKILLTGSNGQLGKALIEKKPEDMNLVLSNRDSFDLTSKSQLESFIKECKPDLILNAAAYTAVDKAESEKDLAFNVNALAPKYLAEISMEFGIKLLHISTDFVFDGSQNFPYKTNQKRSPISVYGYTKSCGEEFIENIMKDSNDGFIVRTSWLMGPVGKNFARTILKLVSERDQINIVSDQIGCPTTTLSLSTYCWEVINIINKGKILPKILHYTNSGIASWYDIAVAIKEIGLELGLFKNGAEILPIKAIDYPTPAIRPVYSVLDCSSSLEFSDFSTRSHWRTALKEVLSSTNIT